MKAVVNGLWEVNGFEFSAMAKFVRCLFQALLPVNARMCEELLDTVVEMVKEPTDVRRGYLQVVQKCADEDRSRCRSREPRSSGSSSRHGTRPATFVPGAGRGSLNGGPPPPRRWRDMFLTTEGSWRRWRRPQKRPAKVMGEKSTTRRGSVTRDYPLVTQPMSRSSQMSVTCKTRPSHTGPECFRAAAQRLSDLTPM